MADLYNQSYPQRSSQYQMASSNQMVYTNQLVSPHSAHQSNNNNHNTDRDDSDSPPKSAEPPSPTENKPPQKTQSTFLTKLYALLEKPENQHMIRWDPAGDHIIVERPEQLALHVLPSVYRQSRFASFSRQLNIYGFMRKVNLRNVDPAIDDPDASTWSHPTLNRHSPPEVVANFKRRVPPRLPKPRKRQEQELAHLPAPPRSAIGMAPIPLTVPSSVGLASPGSKGRARGFSAPGSFTPLSQGGAVGWGTSYPRASLPPLTVPSEPQMAHGGLYSHSPHTLHPISPSDDTPHSTTFSPTYSNNGMVGSQYPYSESSTWSFSPVSNNSSSGHSGSLSSLLNPSGNQYQRPSLNSYPAPFSSVPMHNNHSGSSLSPDSRPTTGYSVSSMSSLPPYDTDSSSQMSHDYSRPGSSHHRPSSPSCQPRQYSKSSYPPLPPPNSSLSIRRPRRHSQAVSPYPSPYEHMDHDGQPGQRPSASPQPGEQHHSSMPRVRSMIQLPSVETSYSYNPAQGDFAYSAGGATHPHSGPGMDAMGGDAGAWSRSVRPSTSTSSLSAASHSSSQANTPPVDSGYGDTTDINRFSPDLGFVRMNDGVAAYTKSSTMASLSVVV